MAELILREIDASVVDKLKQRAAEHDRTLDEEHKAILLEALFGSSEIGLSMSFENYLHAMPDVGEDEDFSRADDTSRSIDLTD